MGYARTKSLPSIIAGCTVGLLCKSNKALLWRAEQRLTIENRRTRWISHTEPGAVRGRIEPSRFHHPGWLVNSKGYPVAKARPRGSQHTCYRWSPDLW